MASTVIDDIRPRYEILGPLRVAGTSPTAYKTRLVLAVLLVRAGQVVTTDHLSSELWGRNAPRRATATVQVYVSQLRKFLCGTTTRADSPIRTFPPGYLLSLERGELDLHVFESLVLEGRQHARLGRHEEAVARFQAALDLWHGPALDGLDAPSVSAYASWLEEMRLECAELLAESSLALGRHRDLVGPLYLLVGANPTREAFYRQLMLALFRSERQADALKVYQAARETLTGELGLEPCRALRELHRAILAGDDRLYHHAA
jgi:SARP family transcriptional regulator, regulator of embCAB operon